MSFNQPILNEMMARSTQEYRERDLVAARRRRLVRSTAQPRRPRRRRHRPFARLRHASRTTA